MVDVIIGLVKRAFCKSYLRFLANLQRRSLQCQSLNWNSWEFFKVVCNHIEM